MPEGDWGVRGASITLPPFADPNSPHIFIGAANDASWPAALTTYLQGNGWDPVGGMLAYANATQYTFFVEAVAFPGEFPAGWIFGSFNSPVFETQILTDGGIVFVSPFGESITLSIGSGAGAGLFEMVSGSTGNIDAGATLDIAGNAVVGSGGEIEVASGGRFQVDDGGEFIVEPGGNADFEGATEFHDASSTFLDWFANVRIDPNGVKGPTSIGRGLLGRQWSNTSNSGTTFFPVAWQGPTITYRTGRAFRVTIEAMFSNTAAGNFAVLDLTTGVGTNIVTGKRTPPLQLAANQTALRYVFEFRNNSGSDLSTGTEIRLTSSAGTTTIAGTATNPIVFLVEDIGDAAEYLNMPSL